MLKHRTFKGRRIATALSAIVVAATVTFGGVLHAQAGEVDSAVNEVDSAVTLAEMQERSAAIPQQPAADPATGKQIGGITAFNEPVWTRTCDRGHGMETWNTRDPKDCAGTMSYYYYNIKKASFNMARFMAGQPSNIHHLPGRLIAALDNWCDRHPFQCELVVGVALLPASILFTRA